MSFPKNTSPYFAQWQQHCRDLPTRNPAALHLASMLDGVEYVYEAHPKMAVTGFEGRLLQCWRFWQFLSGARGEFTVQGSVFIHGWRDVTDVRTVADWLGMPDLVARLDLTAKELAAFSPEDLDRYDALFGRINFAPLQAERLEDLDKAERLSQILDAAYGNETMRDLRVDGPPVSAAIPPRTFDKPTDAVELALIRLLDGFAQSDPNVCAAFGDPATTPAPEIPPEPADTHHRDAVEAIHVVGTPKLLSACTAMGLWLDAGLDLSPMQKTPANQRIVSPSFMRTKAGQSLCVLGFYDGVILVDTESWTELARDTYDTPRDGKRGPEGHAKLATKPQVHVDATTGKITEKSLFKRLPKPLVYAQ